MEEDIKILEELIKEHKKLGNTSEETRISKILFERIIQAIENLIARNKELEEWYELFNKTNPEKMKVLADSFHEKMANKFDEEFIPKSKVKEKIENLECDITDCFMSDDGENCKECIENCSYNDIIRYLQELLEES